MMTPMNYVAIKCNKSKEIIMHGFPGLCAPHAIDRFGSLPNSLGILWTKNGPILGNLHSLTEWNKVEDDSPYQPSVFGGVILTLLN